MNEKSRRGERTFHQSIKKWFKNKIQKNIIIIRPTTTSSKEANKSKKEAKINNS